MKKGQNEINEWKETEKEKKMKKALRGRCGGDNAFYQRYLTIG